jgi:hypothetical protein
MDEDKLSNLYRGPSIDASYKVSVIWTSDFREYFLEPDQSEKKIACGGHAHNRIGTKYAIFIAMFHRCFIPSSRSFVQVVSEEKIFLNRPIRKTNCLWRPCLLTDRDEMCNRYRGPSIDAFCQDLIHLAKRFQKRRFKKIDQSKSRIAFGGHVY